MLTKHFLLKFRLLFTVVHIVLHDSNLQVPSNSHKCNTTTNFTEKKNEIHDRYQILLSSTYINVHLTFSSDLYMLNSIILIFFFDKINNFLCKHVYRYILQSLEIYDLEPANDADYRSAIHLGRLLCYSSVC